MKRNESAIVLTFVAVVSAMAGSATRAQTTLPSSSVEAGAARLIAESENLLPVKPEAKDQPQLGRPHPLATANLIGKPGAATEAAKIIGNPKITPDPMRDIYVRWHLLPIILTADAKEAKECAPEMLKCLKNLPDFYKLLPGEKLRPTYADIPYAQKYLTLFYKTGVTVGYPPYQRTYYPPEAEKYYTPEQKKIADAAAAELKTMAPPKMTAGDKDWESWNNRRNGMWVTMAQMRFELMYALARSGNDQALDAILKEFIAKAKTEPAKADDVVQGLNAALRDGSLSRYKPEKLAALAAQLKQGAGANKTPFAYLARQNVTLPNSILHLTQAIESGRIPSEKDSAAQPLAGPAAAPPPASQPVITNETLTYEAIEAALTRGVNGMMDRGALTPFANSNQFWSYMVYVYLPVQDSVVVWSLLSTGQSFQDPVMQRQLNWIMCYDSDQPFDLSTRLQVIGQLPGKGYEAYLKRDMEQLAVQVNSNGNFTLARPGVGRDEWGNNADGQYGVMGMWIGERRGYSPKTEVWQKVDQYWRKAQLPPAGNEAGWGLYAHDYVTANKTWDPTQPPFSASGPMTAAGCMSLSRTDHVLRSAQRADVGQAVPRELTYGLNWLDRHFTFEDTRGDQDNYYYMWAIQNLGQATGYRTFNKIDWFRDATVRLLNSQQPNGTWYTTQKGAVIPTTFALLYLSRARGPLAVCKLRFDGEWNNRPADLFNFTEYCSEQFEVPTSWLIADPSQPVYELIESPLLYVATDKPFTLKDEEAKRLRDYVDAGGMIVCAPEGKNLNNALKSFHAMANQIVPGREAKKLDKKHPFYVLQQKVTGNIPVSVIDNVGGRPLIAIVEKDISRDLQIDDAKNRDAFRLMANIYLYATGHDSQRPRLKTNYIVATGKEATQGRSIGAARLKTSTGQWDPEPLALPQLAAFMATKHGIDVKLATCSAAELSDKQQIAFLTVSPGTVIDDAEAKAIQAWCQAGGTLWIDTARGDGVAAGQTEALLGKLGINGSALATVGRERAIISGKGLTNGYDLRRPAWRRFGGRGDSIVASAKVNGRTAIYVSRSDIASGLAGINTWEIAGLEPKYARELIANVILIARDGDPTPGTPATTQSTTQPTTRPTANVAPAPIAPATAPVATTAPTSKPSAPQ